MISKSWHKYYKHCESCGKKLIKIGNGFSPYYDSKTGKRIKYEDGYICPGNITFPFSLFSHDEVIPSGD